MSFLDRPQSLWWRKLLFQLHLWVGLGVGLYVFLMGVTGAALVFRDEIEHALHRNLIQYGDASARPDLFSFADMLRQAYSDLQLASISMPSEDHPNVVAYLVKDERQAHEKSPGASLLSISFPLNEHGHIRVFLARQHPPSYETADYHYFDPFTGQHVTVWRRGLNQSLGDAVISWLGPLHFGTFGGPGAAGVIVKILWVLLGLAPPTLMVTGFLMYWNRYLSKKWAHLKHQRERQIQQGMRAGIS
jgi:uncharacterized iron-regulated membrane protein